MISKQSKMVFDEYFYLYHSRVLMAPWIIVSFIAAGSFILAWVFVYIHESGSKERSHIYRERYMKLIDDLDFLVSRTNQLHVQAVKTRDVVLLDHYQSMIKMIETLLLAVKKLNAYGDDSDLLQAPLFLTKDIGDKLSKIELAMLKSMRGKPHDFMKAAPAMAHTVIGCHFCSKPFDAHNFGKVRVKIDNRSEEVTACEICREKLLNTRKARVLFFNEDGKQVHWSKAKSWTPSPEYWNINRDENDGKKKAPHLELVYSNISRINPSDVKH